MYGLQAEAHFDGAHFLTNYYGKCENLHGHRWRVVATIEVEDLQDGTNGEGALRDDGTVTNDGPCATWSSTLACSSALSPKSPTSLTTPSLWRRARLRPQPSPPSKAKASRSPCCPFRTTAENLARWFFDRLAERNLPVSQIEVDETPNNRAFYAHEGHVGR